MLVYNLTHQTETCLARIEQLRGELDRLGPAPRVWVGRTRREIEVDAVAASTRMEGVPITVDEARRILAGDLPTGVTPETAALVDGYRDAMRYVLARSDDPHFTWHVELILAIHDRVLAGSYANGAGRLRARQNWVSSGLTGAQVYLPPAPEAVPSLLSQLVSWLAEFDGPAPIAAAIGHVGLAAIHPFSDGNGRTARILASLVMCRAGYQSPQFTSLEEWWGRHIQQYYAAFNCLGSEWRPDVDVSAFVETHVCAQATQVDALSLQNAVSLAIWTVLTDIAVTDLGLAERVTHALYDATLAREITNRYYRGLADVSYVTASHDLRKLVASGLLRQMGSGRSSRYIGTDRLLHAVARDSNLDERALPAGAPLEAQRDALLAALGRRLSKSGD